MSDTYDEIIRRWKNNTQELDPSTYDASYELVAEIIKSYSKLKDFSVCDYNDLDLIYLSTIGTWKHSVEKKKESIYKSNLSEKEKEHLINFISSLWERVNNKEFSHSELNDKITFGMFGTGFFTTKNKTDNEFVQKFVRMCVDLLPIEDDEIAFEIVDKTISNGFKGLAAGGISVILHCLKPFVFPILNSHQGKKNIFEKLGIDIVNYSSETTYIANSRKIKEYRDANFPWKNYRIFDLENVDSQFIEEKEIKMEQEKIIESYKNLLEANRNLILHGAPGTGKTHTAKDIAAQMICGKSYAEVEKDDALNKQFNEQTEFVQFHPSYDYSDFVEGLRPIEGDNRGDVGFERKDGVFKKFCERALKAKEIEDMQTSDLSANESIDNNLQSTDLTEDDFEKRYSLFIDKIKENKIPIRATIHYFYVVYDPKKYKIIAVSEGGGEHEIYKKDLEECYSNEQKFKDNHKNENITFTVSISRYLHENINKNDSIVNKIVKQPYIFIIDEINRGEMSKIFGELFFSIDPDYRGTKGKVRTQYANMLEETNDFDDALGITTSYGHFFVPENVYIIGTMNDIDRSVDSMDFAMRRRFTFMELKANECLAMLDDLQFSDGISKDDIIAKMTALNSEIEKIPGLSSAYHIGGSYFAKLNKYADKPKDEAYKCLWNNHLKPLLTDYLRGLPNLEAKLSSFKTKYDEAEFVAPKNSDE